MSNPDDILHVGRPNIGNRELFDRLVDGIFERRWFSNNGELVRELERKLCELLGVRHCIPVCNGTIGLQIAIHALDLKGEVITTPYTFVATPHALVWEGLQPVFADIDPETHNLDPERVEACITERTSAIIGVHVWGRPCEVDRLEAIGERHGLPVMFDAAHAFSCSHGGRRIGNFGRCEVFSFHATKFFNSFEGGAIATNDDELAHRIRLMKNFGFERLDTVVEIGTNAKLSEIHAAMGLACLDRIDNILSANRERHALYRERLSPIEGIRFMDYDDVEDSNYQYVVIEVDEASFGRSRDSLMEHLFGLGIRARRYFFPGCHRMAPYASRMPESVEGFPQADRVCARSLILPTGTAVKIEEVERVCDEIVRFAGHL